jgi:hypothetical protein
MYGYVVREMLIISVFATQQFNLMCNCCVVQVNILAMNLDDISAQSTVRVRILASWHAMQPTRFPSLGGTSVTIFGACLPTSLMSLEFSGT